MSLAEKLSNLTNPTPIFHDPEDVDDDTAAKLTARSQGTEDVAVAGTALRRKMAPLLEEEDVRYAGRAVSRRALTDSDVDPGGSESDEDDEESGDSDNESENIDNESGDTENESKEVESGSDNSGAGSEDVEEETEDEESEVDDLETFKKKLRKTTDVAETFTFTDDGDYNKYADDDEGEATGSDDNGSDVSGSDEESGSGDEESDGDDASEGDSDEEDSVAGGAMLGLSEKAESEEVAKGRAATNQLALWDALLEARIRLQKSLQLVNQLPQPDTAHAFMAAAGAPLSSALKAGNGALKQLLEKLVELQSLLLLQYPQTQHVLTGAQPASSKRGAVSDGSDEEITSEEEDGGKSGDSSRAPRSSGEDAVAKAEQEARRKRKLKEYPEIVAKRHKAFAQFRDATIEKWYDKTRVSAGRVNKGFSAFEQPTLKQIHQVLRDRKRLIERTRVKRSAVNVLGKPRHGDQPEAETDDLQERAELRRQEEETNYDAEIFDDGDFYHRLLRELIERKTQGVTDPIALSRQWIQMQSLRKRNKRRVDPRASKGRKIRYDIHPKLVNLMAPVDACEWLDQARDELYSSLFGQVTQSGAETIAPKG